jgi:hypothetical protein
VLPTNIRAKIQARQQKRRKAHALIESLDGYAAARVQIHERAEAALRQLGTPVARTEELLGYTLGTLRINAEAIVELIFNIGSQRAYVTVLEEWADWAWAVYTGTSPDLYPPVPAIGPLQPAGDAIAREVRHWTNEGFRRIVKSQQAKRDTKMPWASSRTAEEPIEPVSGRMASPMELAPAPSPQPELTRPKTLGERLDDAKIAADISHEEQAHKIGLSRTVYFEVKAGRGGRGARRQAEKYLNDAPQSRRENRD